MKAFWITAFSLLLATAAPVAGYAQDSAEQPAAAAEESTNERAAEAVVEGEEPPTPETSPDTPTEIPVDTAEDGEAAEDELAAEPAAEDQPADTEETATGADGADAADANGEGEETDEEDFGPVIVDQGGTFWMPPQASTIAPEVDWLFYAITALSIFCFVGITIAVVWFTIRYRARDGRRPEPSATHNDAMEITWTIIPSIIVVIIFVLGWQGYMKMAAVPQHAEEVRVTASKWSWEFTYPNGYRDHRLHVPVNRPVRLVMTSQDVLHSLFVPAFRVKMDVLPFRYTRMWFEATEPGTYRLYCAEYCGTAHANMIGEVVVHPPGGYERYLEEAQQRMMDLPPVELGELLYVQRGCRECHSIDGTSGQGPTLAGIWGVEQQYRDGTHLVDDDHIRMALLDPQARVRTGYNPVMPTFRGRLSDREIEAIIEYIKSLADE
jgi:cytochrome c oxidase subunit II